MALQQSKRREWESNLCPSASTESQVQFPTPQLPFLFNTIQQICIFPLNSSMLNIQFHFCFRLIQIMKGLLYSLMTFKLCQKQLLVQVFILQLWQHFSMNKNRTLYWNFEKKMFFNPIHTILVQSNRLSLPRPFLEKHPYALRTYLYINNTNLL